MAKAIIIIEDEGEEVNIKCNFEPEIENDSGAHSVAIQMLSLIGHGDFDEDDFE